MTQTAETIKTLAQLLGRDRAKDQYAPAVPLRDAWRMVGEQYTSPVDAETAEKYAVQYPDIHRQCLAGAIQEAELRIEGNIERAKIRQHEQAVAAGFEIVSGNVAFPDTDPNSNFDA